MQSRGGSQAQSRERRAARARKFVMLSRANAARWLKISSEAEIGGCGYDQAVASPDWVRKPAREIRREAYCEAPRTPVLHEMRAGQRPMRRIPAQPQGSGKK